MDKQQKIMQGQLIATAMYMIVLITSFIVLYNQYLLQKEEKPILSEKESQNINILNRIVVLILVSYFLYTSYENIKLAKQKDEELKYLNLQFIASLITVISALIVLYVSFNQYQKSLIPISSIENPNI